MKMYVYFVAYTGLEKALFKTTISTGNVEVEVNRKIEDIETIRAIEEKIRTENGYSRLVITNYILLREEEKA